MSPPASTAATKLSSVLPGAIRSAPLWPTKRNPADPWVARALEELVLAGEDLRDGVVGEDAPDRVGEGAGGREHGDVVRGAGAKRNRVGDDYPLDLRVLVGEPCERRAGEAAAGGAR